MEISDQRHAMAASLPDKEPSNNYTGAMLWRGWLRHCATIRKVAGSIPGSVIGIFH